MGFSQHIFSEKTKRFSELQLHLKVPNHGEGIGKPLMMKPTFHFPHYPIATNFQVTFPQLYISYVFTLRLDKENHLAPQLTFPVLTSGSSEIPYTNSTPCVCCVSSAKV